MFKLCSRPVLLSWRICALLMACLSAALVQAQNLSAVPDVVELSQRWVEGALASANASARLPLRMEVSLGALDSRLRLAPCAQIEPYIPVGTRLWGKTRLGLRCLEGATKWNVFLPVTVKAIGSAWVIRGDVPSGAVLTEADAMEAQVDWAEETSSIVSNPAQWVGQVATRALSTGQALRQSMIRQAQVFQAGAQVRVLAQGTGFQISSDGQALSAGVVGQPARVRMDSGRVMSGVVLDGHTVKLEI
jgi:flagella basal body P-ring formation protein FlgA